VRGGMLTVLYVLFQRRRWLNSDVMVKALLAGD
jgi:hypothetical protein